MTSNAKQITYDVELSTVGSLLAGGLTANARDVLSWLKPEMFATYQIGAVFAAIQKQANKDNLIDMLMLSSDYGIALADMAEMVKKTGLSSANLSGYANKLLKCYQRREAQRIFLEIAGELNHSRDEQLDEITTKGLTHLSRLMSKQGKIEPTEMPALLEGYVELLQERMKPEFKARLLFTGNQHLDAVLQGIDETDICIVGGRAGNGKTETAITFTKHILETGGSVLFFSLEMSRHQIMDRLIASASGVNSAKLRNPERMNDEDFARMNNVIGPMSAQKFFVVDKGALTVEEIKAITERHLNEYGKLSAIIIDYVGLIQHGLLDGRVNRTYQIGETVESLKAFSKQTHIPIILLSQLNRDAEGSVPKNSDLSDSKSLEQVASQIIMVHNKRDKETNEPAKYTQWLVTKNRNGKVGTVYVEFQNGRFVECDQVLANQYFEEQKPTKKEKPKGF